MGTVPSRVVFPATLALVVPTRGSSWYLHSWAAGQAWGIRQTASS